jgi:hypothetical protein
MSHRPRVRSFGSRSHIYLPFLLCLLFLSVVVALVLWWLDRDREENLARKDASAVSSLDARHEAPAP